MSNTRTLKIINRDIIRAWYYYDNDSSTEWLFARVIDHFGGMVDCGDIATALRDIAGMSMSQIEQEYKLKEFVP